MIQVQHLLESKDPEWKAIIKCADVILWVKIAYICLSTYWVGEAKVEVLHTKIQQLLLLQRATDVADNLLCDKHIETCSQHEQE